ncbi:MAG TPA: hypothetical protein PLM35_06030 [Cyclobacteriaceae bacterium]|nr:hypothetical protein [Cyclobacteriaceae bacterium]
MRFGPLVIALALLSSCAPMYVPNVRNAPLFNGKGEFQAAAFIGTGIDLQGALALSDHIGITGNYSFLRETRNDPFDPSQKFKRKNNFFEGGIGYYKASRSRRIELYAGYGQGKGTTTGQYGFLGLGQQEVIVTGKYKRIFIQPSIGTNNSRFSLALTPRISLVDFHEFQTGPIKESPDDGAHLFIEPAATARFRMAENLNGIFQLGVNIPSPNDTFFDHVAVQASFGVQLHLGESLKAKMY